MEESKLLHDNTRILGFRNPLKTHGFSEFWQGLFLDVSSSLSPLSLFISVPWVCILKYMYGVNAALYKYYNTSGYWHWLTGKLDSCWCNTCSKLLTWALWIPTNPPPPPHTKSWLHVDQSWEIVIVAVFVINPCSNLSILASDHQYCSLGMYFNTSLSPSSKNPHFHPCSYLFLIPLLFSCI